MKIRHEGKTVEIDAKVAVSLEGDWCILEATLDDRLVLSRRGVEKPDCSPAVMLGTRGTGERKRRGNAAYYRSLQARSIKARARNAKGEP